MNTETSSIAIGPRGELLNPAAPWNPQRMSTMPHGKYRSPHERVAIPALVDRRWPNARFTTPPLWVPVDLRDGNQALAEPMDPERKRRMFRLFVEMGYKEIEVGYPSASSLDFDFVRELATSDLVPEDVTIVVFTAARRDLIERTIESVRSLPRVVVHMYIATAPLWREVVLGKDRAELSQIVLSAAEDMARGADSLAGSKVRFQFSPEVFNLTEPDYIVELCNTLTEFWDASPERPVTHNLLATVEIGTPSLYADQIEYLSRHLARRDSVILSVHPHNDRGTGVAAAELAVLAGAQRVEGCVFGNGERTGNVDIATLALNLYSQGVNPSIDFSNIDAIRETVEWCTRLPIDQRQPYVGDLIYTAFSGTHQDAIKKGFEARKLSLQNAAGSELEWSVPYLHIDPRDVGRDYEAVIRVNSQSGRGGVAYLLKEDHGLDLPRGLQIDFAPEIQALSEQHGGALSSAAIHTAFLARYVDPVGEFRLREWSVDESSDACRIAMTIGERALDGTGEGPLEACLDAFRRAGISVDIVEYSENAVCQSGVTSEAASFVKIRHEGREGWGVGIDPSILGSGLRAIVAAVARLVPALPVNA